MVLPIQFAVWIEDWRNICVVGVIANREVRQVVKLAIVNLCLLQFTTQFKQERTHANCERGLVATRRLGGSNSARG